MNQQNNQLHYIEEDRIDLRDLWKTLTKQKVMILSVTALLTILAAAYAFMAKPVYEAKAVVEIGYIGGKLLDEPSAIKEKVAVIFHVDKPLEGETTIVASAETMKKVKNMLVVKTQALSNDEALRKADEVLHYIADEYAYKVKQYKEKNDQEIEKLKRDIALLKKQGIKKLDEKIALLKKQDIKKIDEKITFYQINEIKTIEERIASSEKELQSYLQDNQQLQSEMKKNTLDDPAFTTMAMLQLVNYQNSVTNLRNKILDMQLNKKKILEEYIPNLMRSKEKIIEESIVELQRQQEKILEESIPNLEHSKQKILENDIPSLEDQINTLMFNNTPSYVRNSKIVGDVLTNDYPVKPKKKVIITVAFITGLLLSVFLAFFLEFLRNSKKEELE